MIGEYYLVQVTTNDENWITATEVLGTGSRVGIELFTERPAAAYRLLSRFGTGTPNPPLVVPELRVMKAGNQVRVAWQTNHWEAYALNQIGGDGSPRLVEQVPGDGGVIWFDFPPTTPGQVFQVTATPR